MSADQYGRYYWTVETPGSTIRLHADKAEIIDGCLVFHGSQEGVINMAFSPGQWNHFYAANCMDGGAIAVEHWDPLKHVTAKKKRKSGGA